MAVRIPPRRGVKKTWPAVSITSPGKGLNTVISDEYIADAEASALSNITFVESGCPAKRNGNTAVGTGLSNNPKGLASFYTTANRYVVTIDGTALKYLSGSTWTAIAGASFTSGKNTTFCQAKGSLYIWNGTDAGAKLDSTLTLSRPTTTISASFAIFYSGKQIASGVATQPSRLYISNASDPSDFTVATGGTAPQPDNSTDAPGATSFTGTPGFTEANIVDVAKDDGDKITGLAKFQNQLIIFKERSIWSMTFDSNGVPQIQQVSASVGCVSHRSIDNVNNDVYFLSRNGYYTLGNQQNFFNVIRTNELSIRVHPVIATITPANLGNTASIFSDYVFYSSISTGGTTTNNTTLTYDYRYDAWSQWSNVNANAFTEFIDANNVKHLYYAADDTPQVYEIDTSYSDNGSAISAQWTSKAINFGDFSLYKQVLYIDLEFRQIVGTVKVEVLTDGNTTAVSSSVASSNDLTGTIGNEQWGNPQWGGSASTSVTTTISTNASANVPYRVTVNKTTRTVKIRVSNSNNNETFELLGFKIYFRPYTPTKFPASQKIH